MLIDLRDVTQVIYNNTNFSKIYIGEDILWSNTIVPTEPSEKNVFKVQFDLRVSAPLYTVTLYKPSVSATPDVLTDWGDGTIDDKLTHTYSTSFLTSHNPVTIKSPYLFNFSGGDTDALIHLEKLSKYINKYAMLFEQKNIKTVATDLLTATGVVVEDYSYMFSGCFYLENAPMIPHGAKSCTNMFSNCRSLKDVPVDLIPETVTTTSSMFMYCDELENAPIIPKNILSCSSMFSGNGYYTMSLKTLPQQNIDLLTNHPDNLNHSYCYEDCTKLVTPPYESIPNDWK